MMLRRLRLARLAVAVAVLALIVSGGWLWLRDCALVRVRQVTVTGITASDGDRVRASLERTGLEMTTLHVREQALRDAVKPYASVAALKVRSDFPRGLTIQVVEQRPVAALESQDATRRVPVTAAGVVLTDVNADRDLPTVITDRSVAAARVTDLRLRRALAVAGAAPPALLHRADELQVTGKGVVVALREGPPLIFGTPEEATRKWAAAARVLAEPSTQGATYLDLRIPGRVAAGGLDPLAPDPAQANPQPQGQNGATLSSG